MKARVSRFPDPRKNQDVLGDIVALGGELTPEYLIDAYAHGIFPWPTHDSPEIPWFCPLRRALLVFDQVHVPRSLAKARRQSRLKFTIDRDFRQVIEACRDSPRPGQAGTWITDEIVQGYFELHRLGRAHSVEAWDGEALVGGVYGVDGGGYFSAESMFFKQENASKLALLHLVDHLRSRGGEWLDIQMLTPHMEKLGAREFDREEFLELLDAARKAGHRLF